MPFLGSGHEPDILHHTAFCKAVRCAWFHPVSFLFFSRRNRKRELQDAVKTDGPAAETIYYMAADNILLL